MQTSIAFANLEAIIEKKRLLSMINKQYDQHIEWEIEIAKRIACGSFLTRLAWAMKICGTSMGIKEKR